MPPETSPHPGPLDHSATGDRFRPLFALSPLPAWVYDTQSLRFLEVNEAAVRNYGWSRAEFLGMTIRDIRPPTAQADLDTHLARALLVGESRVQSVHRTKTGRVLTVEISSFPIEFDARAARMVLVHDITDREAAALALATSEENYRSVVEQLQDVFFRTDAGGAWTFLNRAWTSLTGNTVEGSLGTNFLTFVHPSDRRVLLDAYEPLANGKVDRSQLELRYFHRAGGHRWVEATTHASRGEDGSFLGTTGTLRDITERRAANEERQRLATNIRQLLDASGEGIYGCDTRGRLTFMNRRGLEMLGFEHDELVGQSLHDLTHHTKRDGSPYPVDECPLQRAALEGIPCEVDDEVMWRKDGSSIQVEYTASPVREGDRLTGTVVNFRDVTARKRAELDLIEARDAAEAANRAKSDFLARMSHELRTPLNSIIGFANVLNKNKHGSFRDDEVAYLARISGNGKHLLGLINDILDLSKIEAGRMTLELSPVMLDTLVRETVAEFEPQIRDKAVALRMVLPDVIQSIEMDASRMKQVLINLIGNALKFTDSGEVVVSLDTDTSGRPARLAVRDTGIGIPQHRLAAIFNVFEQAESTTSRRFGGTGLGLAISRSLCELMGHHLDVTSIEGLGTTMSIRLGVGTRTWRRSTPMLVPVIPSPDRTSPTNAPTVLVVDDDADARLLLQQLVEETGCRVMQAESGTEALRIAREVGPAMIFLDLRLPRISGFDVFRILKSDPALRDIPVVIASVVGSESAATLAGAAAVLDKPLSRDQVFQVIRRWLPRSIAPG